MNIEKLTRKSHYYNEDRYIIGDNFAMVIDGATSLIPSGFTPSEGCWLVNLIKCNIVNEQGSIINRLDNISKKGYSEFKSARKKDISYLPSASIAWVEFSDKKVICRTIGDCEIVIKFKDNTLFRMIRPELPKLDSYALQKMKEEADKHQIPFLNARKYIDDLLIYHRTLMNKENGYAAFTISENPNFDYESKTFNIDDISEIYIYSDGITQAFDELKIYNNYQEMFKKSLDLKEEVSKIVRRCNEDILCNKYHRFKKNDDITIIKIVT